MRGTNQIQAMLAIMLVGAMVVCIGCAKKRVVPAAAATTPEKVL
jgi:hypothetical protein